MCDWALSDTEAERLAIARALAHQIDVPAADGILRNLVEDPAPAVRRAALDAIGEHLWSNASFVAETADIALSDGDRRVRHAARKLLRRRVIAPRPS